MIIGDKRIKNLFSQKINAFTDRYSLNS